MYRIKKFFIFIVSIFIKCINTNIYADDINKIDGYNVIFSNNLSKTFFIGLLFIVLTPVVVITLFVTVIGIPFALILLLIYILILSVLNILNTVIITGYLVNNYPKLDSVYLKILIIIFIGTLFSFINGLGLLIGCFTLGGLFIFKKQLIDGVNK